MTKKFKFIKCFFIFIFLLNTNLYSNNFLKFIAGPLLRPQIEKKYPNNKWEDFKSNPLIVNPEEIEDNFESVILNENVKNNFKMIVDFLKNPDKFYKIGAKPPKGILLYGPPGTGKTSLGRALAKESKSSFIYIAGPEFDGMWVGDGSNKVREIFNLAREKAPAIIFIDEIDTIGKKRHSLEHRYQTQTIQQLLVELDGFKQNKKPVIVIATTNNISHLDKALLRSGRFDLQIEIDNPNKENKKKIFLKYLSKVKKSKEVNDQAINDLCNQMENFTGADIENVVNQATLNALAQNQQEVKIIHFTKAINDLKIQKEQQ